jgi:CheY-like chemotaxis protein
MAIRVLIVDDSRVTREVTKVYLIARDVSILEARQGEDALKVARESKPDVVIADLQMPKLDGAGLCRAMQTEPTLAVIPVIILTSNADALSKTRCLSAGAKEVLNKPVQPSDLIAAINRQLGHRSPYA